MLEVRKSTFSKNYENSFFREFSRHLYKTFKEKNLTGILIGSPSCQMDTSLQIDALLITQSVVCIIDFKNFSGKITLPSETNFEAGIWTTEKGEQIKGGNSINPFVQLKKQRKKFYDVTQKAILNKLSKGDIFNPARVIRIICFQGDIQLQGKIPGNESNTFFIIDRENFVESIFDIIDVTDKEVKLSANSFDAFKNIFRADQFKFDDRPLEDKLKDVASKSTKLDYGKLYDDQKAALTEIKSFLENQEQQIFILQGTTNSGKSYLIPFIQELAFNAEIQETEIFAASSRVAKNLVTQSGIEKVNSIYSYIYGGNATEKDQVENKQEEITTENEEQEASDEILLEKVPLKKNNDADNALYIVDESQLVSDSPYHSIDLVFGSGKLLQDFICFTELKEKKRKIIFIGDPYQLQLGKTDESPLNPLYLEETYKLKIICFQLLDKEEYSDITKEALTCVKSIKAKAFSSLHFTPSEQFAFLKKENVHSYVTNLVIGNLGHILCFSHKEVQDVNQWIKKSIIKSGEDIAQGDLILFHNNISVEDENDPFSEPKQIYNGQFAKILKVNANPITEQKRNKKGEVIATLNFRELEISLNDTNQTLKILSLENFRLNSTAELSKDELFTYKLLLNSLLDEFNPLTTNRNFDTNEMLLVDRIKTLEKQLKEGKRVKTKLLETKRTLSRKILLKTPSSKYYKIKNAAQLKFGWALTIDKSSSYKWQDVMINTEPGSRFSNSKTHEPYFRMIYTGITRAKQNVMLHNYKPITPFEKTEFHDSNTGAKPKEIFYVSENSNGNERLAEFEQFIHSKINLQEWKIQSHKHSQYQMLYTFQSEQDKEAVLSVYFKDNGRFNYPTVMKTNPKEFGESVISILKTKSNLKQFAFITDEWRRLEYEALNAITNSFDLSIEYILQAPNRDYVNIFNKDSELNLVIDYSGVDKTINKITARYYTQIELWNNFQNAISKLKEK